MKPKSHWVSSSTQVMSGLRQRIVQLLNRARERFDRVYHWRYRWSQGSVDYRLSLTTFTCKPGIPLIGMAEFHFKWNNVISTLHSGDWGWNFTFLMCSYSRGSETLLVLKGLAAVFSHVPMDHCQNLPELRENGAEKRYCLGRPLMKRYSGCLLQRHRQD